MKKIILTIFLIFIGIIAVNAKKIKVNFSDCVDSDTAKFIYKKEEITARFLAIDTPETLHPTKEVEKFGKEASEYTCNKLKNAEQIELEYDDDSDELDKYDRHLVWVFVDGDLLQKKLVNKGLGSVAYLYGDYKYTEELEEAEQEAENQKLGIWSIEKNEEENTEDKKESADEADTKKESKRDYKEIIILIGIVVILCIFSSKTRRKVKNKAKREMIKEIKKRFK